jgi:hypothetical protein
VGDRRPTLADIGALFVFRADARSRLKEMSNYLDNLDPLRLDEIRSEPSHA